MAKTWITVENDRWTAVDSGAQYIEIRTEGETVDVINVWDYFSGKRREPFTPKSCERHLDRWIAECGADFETHVTPYLKRKKSI